MTRDWEFAKKFGLPIIEVVTGGEDVQKAAFTAQDETGIMVNSDFLNGMTVEDANPAMIEWLSEKGIGRAKVQLQAARLGILPSALLGRADPDRQLRQVRLRSAAGGSSFRSSCRTCTPTSRPTTASPRCAHMTDWVNTTCPCCGGPAKRETDTMPQWAGSSWYFLRYMRPAQRQGAGLQGSARILVCRSTGTTAAWSTPRCICCTAASGTSSCMTSALSRPRSRMQSAPATA